MRRTIETDYAIVGAGSAGCVLADRLSEDRDIQVLMLEAGSWDRDPWIHIPLGWGRIMQRRLHDWMYFAEPDPTMNGREIECARGKVVGGSSSINAMAYYHWRPEDFDRWAAAGLPDWSFANVLPYFRRQEAWEGGANAYRGGDGPLATRYSRFQDPLCDAYLEAGGALGHGATEDYNGATQEGFARLQMTIRDGRRCSAASAFLRPAMGRPNLRVQTATLVTKILLEGRRATGLECLRNGQTFEIRVRREVILAGGSINSPQLLMLSGIGDPDDLRAQGIGTKVSRRGVGRNLRDHTAASIAYRRKSPGPFQRNMRLDRIAWSLGKAYCFGKGFATDLPLGVTAFLRTRHAGPIPDIQMHFWMGATSAAAPYPPFRAPPDDSFSCRIMPLRPTSTGAVRLASADPTKPVRIHQNFLGTDAEWRTLIEGFRMLRELGRQAALAPFVAAETQPGPDCQSDAAIEAHIRATMLTVHHPVGTCKMGAETDETAVVDGHLRVIGTEGLRVVDGSVLPDLGGAANAPIMMIADRAADMILDRAPLRPASL